jgi:hypothetical protein
MKSQTLIPLFVVAALWPFLTPALVQAQAAGVQITVVEPKPATIQIIETSDLPQAIVVSAHGKCEYSNDGITFTELTVGHVLYQGAVVRTGEDARTAMFFRRTGTSVRFQQNSVVKLERMTRVTKAGVSTMRTSLNLRKGIIFTVVRSAVPHCTFEIINAAGRAVVEGGPGRYIITADGTHVVAKDSLAPIKVTYETGVTEIAPGQTFQTKDGKLMPLATPEAVLSLIAFDELDTVAELAKETNWPPAAKQPPRIK